MDAEAFALRAEIERLAALHAVVATHAARLEHFGECWIATADHTHVSDERQGSGRRVAIAGELIDPIHISHVPESKRELVTEAGLGMRWDALQRETQELLDGSLLGDGDLTPAYDTLADAIDLARRRMEGVMRTA